MVGSDRLRYVLICYVMLHYDKPHYDMLMSVMYKSGKKFGCYDAYTSIGIARLETLEVWFALL